MEKIGEMPVKSTGKCGKTQKKKRKLKEEIKVHDFV